MLSLATALLLAPLSLQSALPPPGSDWVLPPGNTLFTTGNGALHVHSMTIPPGSYLRVVGEDPFEVIADETIAIGGTLDAGGFDAKLMGPLLVPVDLAILGAPGGPGGGAGGHGHPGRWTVHPVGGTGELAPAFGAPLALGGGGGESGVVPPLASGARRCSRIDPRARQRQTFGVES